MQKLHLSGNALTGSIPGELSALTKMQELHLFYNKLTGSIPKELGALIAMQKLHLSGNALTAEHWRRITGRTPEELAALTERYGRHAVGDNLTGKIPREPVGAMEMLSLDHNKLTGSIPKELAALTAMERRNLSYNKLAGRLPPPSYGAAMRDWAGIPEENERSEARNMGGKYSGAEQPFIVRSMDFVTDAWHVVVPVVDDATDVLLLTSTADLSSPFWWVCSIALVVADVERLWLLFTLCLTTGLLPLLLCLDAVHFAIRPSTNSVYWGRTAARVFARINCRDDAPQDTFGGRLKDSFLWVLVGSRSRCSPLWGEMGMGLDASVKKEDHAGIAFGAIDRWVDRHPFRVLGMSLFGSGFELKRENEDVSRRAGVMIRAVGETLVVDSLFLALSVVSGGWDDNLTGVAGISALFSVLELVTELQYYVAEAGNVLEPVTQSER